MTRAYDEKYLDDAMKNLGEAVDFAVNICHTGIDDFFPMFVTSGIAELFGAGVPKYVSGLSGTELAEEIYSASGIKCEFSPPQAKFSFSPEYWCGWTLALYQWFSGNSFKQILTHIDGESLLKLYPSLHEAPEEKSIETLNQMMKRKTGGSNLKIVRLSSGLSQKELSEKSGVNLRTLQQYENKSKNINKAAASTLVALSKALGCRIEDLMEAEYVTVD